MHVSKALQSCASMKKWRRLSPLHFHSTTLLSFPQQHSEQYGRCKYRRPCRLCGTERAHRTWGTSPYREEPASSGNYVSCFFSAWKFALLALPFRHLLVYPNNFLFTQVFPEGPPDMPVWGQPPCDCNRIPLR